MPPTFKKNPYNTLENIHTKKGERFIHPITALLNLTVLAVLTFMTV